MGTEKAHETYSLFGPVTSLLPDVVAHGMYFTTLVPSINGRKHTKCTLSQFRLTRLLFTEDSTQSHRIYGYLLIRPFRTT